MTLYMIFTFSLSLHCPSLQSHGQTERANYWISLNCRLCWRKIIDIRYLIIFAARHQLRNTREYRERYSAYLWEFPSVICLFVSHIMYTIIDHSIWQIQFASLKCFTVILIDRIYGHISSQPAEFYAYSLRSVPIVFT